MRKKLLLWFLPLFFRFPGMDKPQKRMTNNYYIGELRIENRARLTHFLQVFLCVKCAWYFHFRIDAYNRICAAHQSTWSATTWPSSRRADISSCCRLLPHTQTRKFPMSEKILLYTGKMWMQFQRHWASWGSFSVRSCLPNNSDQMSQRSQVSRVNQ